MENIQFHLKFSKPISMEGIKYLNIVFNIFINIYHNIYLTSFLFRHHISFNIKKHEKYCVDLRFEECS